jgi:hypothetical protein
VSEAQVPSWEPTHSDVALWSSFPCARHMQSVAAEAVVAVSLLLHLLVSIVYPLQLPSVHILGHATCDQQRHVSHTQMGRQETGV